MQQRPMSRARSWITHDMLFCLCGWEEDVFLSQVGVRLLINAHRETCNQLITREQAVVHKYEPKP